MRKFAVAFGGSQGLDAVASWSEAETDIADIQIVNASDVADAVLEFNAAIDDKASAHEVYFVRELGPTYKVQVGVNEELILSGVPE